METAVDKNFVEQFLEATMNRQPTRFLCNLGIHYITGELLSLLWGLLKIFVLHSKRRNFYFKKKNT